MVWSSKLDHVTTWTVGTPDCRERTRTVRSNWTVLCQLWQQRNPRDSIFTQTSSSISGSFQQHQITTLTPRNVKWDAYSPMKSFQLLNIPENTFDFFVENRQCSTVLSQWAEISLNIRYARVFSDRRFESKDQKECVKYPRYGNP